MKTRWDLEEGTYIVGYDKPTNGDTPTMAWRKAKGVDLLFMESPNSELHTRQEIERLADELGKCILYDKGKYCLGLFGLGNPFTLTELRDKLLELKKAQSE